MSDTTLPDKKEDKNYEYAAMINTFSEIRRRQMIEAKLQALTAEYKKHLKMYHNIER